MLRDAGAGIVLTALLVPAGMGYAIASGLPPQSGLYATVAALCAYALFGPSPVLVLGPDSSLAPLIAAAVLPLALDDQDRAVALAGLLALMVGVALLAAGAVRLGFVMDLLSKPIRLGYLNGVALVVVVTQLPALLGFSVERGDLLDQLRAFVDGIREGQPIEAAAVVGIGSLVTIVGLRRLAPAVPGVLLVVAVPTLVVWAGGFDSIPVVGPLPRGIPSPALEGLEWSDVGALLPAALGIALVAFADTGTLSRAFAGRTETDVDASREMVGLGAANVACGALGGFPVSASSSRTPVAQAAGARSQLAGVVGAALIVLLLLAAPGLTRWLPSSALAAVVIAAVMTVVDVRGVTGLWRKSRIDFALSIVAFGGVAVFGVLPGVGVAVGLSLAAFVAKAWRPYMAELVRVDQRKGYHDLSRHPEGRRVPGLTIVRFDAPLFFANAETFAAFVEATLDASPQPVRWVVVAAEPVTDVDTTAADVLARLDDELARAGVHLVFAELKGPVKDRLARYGLGERFGPDRYFPTLGTAVSAYLRATGTRWTDWTDEDRAT